MIECDQVLHVARLARLGLTDEEVERYGAKLSKITDWIDKIGELDLEDVRPTSHVVEIENVLRADKPRASLDQATALGSAPDVTQGGFRVPSPGTARNY